MGYFRDDDICESDGRWEFEDVVENRNLSDDPNGGDEAKWRLFVGSDGSSLLDQEVRLELAGGNEESFDRLWEVVLEVDGKSASSGPPWVKERRKLSSGSLVSCSDFNGARLFGIEECGVRFILPISVTFSMCSEGDFLSSSWVCGVWRAKFVSDGDLGNSRRRSLRSVRIIPLGLGVVGCSISCPRGAVALHGDTTVWNGLELYKFADPLSKGLTAGEDTCWGVEEVEDVEEFRNSDSIGSLGSCSVISEWDNEAMKNIDDAQWTTDLRVYRSTCRLIKRRNPF